MMVRPDAMSASSAPSARPLNSCDPKLAQVITDVSQTTAPRAVAAARGAGSCNCNSGVIAQIAAERVRFLHERPAGDDLCHLPEVLLVAHRARRLAAHDDHGAHELVVFLA